MRIFLDEIRIKRLRHYDRASSFFCLKWCIVEFVRFDRDHWVVLAFFRIHNVLVLIEKQMKMIEESHDRIATLEKELEEAKKKEQEKE